MSGFVGIVHLDGAPVDRSLLQRMAERLAFRGPDSSSVHVDGAAGLGHTLLRVTPEPRQEQPASLDGDVWIVSDARLDGRQDLIRELAAQGRTVRADAPDIELILHAYAAWSDKCVHHLLGDFAFALWDQRRRRLFCARDHFGVRPFYFAQLGDCFVFSNTLECVRSHHLVSDTLNDQYIGDFLLFGMNHEPTTTAYNDIHRLPAAHSLTLTLSGSGPTQQRYWTLPADGAVRYRRPQEYVDHFSALFRDAVSDRTRWQPVGLLMSGGLDSAAVAAMARVVLPRTDDLRAVTRVFDRIMPDTERYYSSLVGKHLDIAIDYQVSDDVDLSAPPSGCARRPPEPIDDPLARKHAEFLEMVAAQSRVALTGYGGDPALYPSRDYFSNLLRHGKLARLAADVFQYASSYGRIPPLYLRSRLKRWLAREKPWEPPYPGWLNPEFERRFELRGRWKQVNSAMSNRLHPERPDAYDRLTTVYWPHLFETLDAGVTGLPLDFYHPFFDRRVIDFLIAIPPVPYCADKAILRSSMLGLLPEEVRKRPKTPLVANPLAVLLRQRSSQDVLNSNLKSQISPYVDISAVPQVGGGEITGSPAHPWLHLRPRYLSDWIQTEVNAGTITTEQIRDPV